MKIFIVNGKMTSGKTEFEKMIKEIAAIDNYKVDYFSTIDYVKEKAYNIGWKGEKDKKSRKMLCEFKKLLTEYNDSPYQEMIKKINNYQENNYQAIFIDSREPQDIKRFVDDFGALTILIKRNNIKDISCGNTADDNVDNYSYNYIIKNDGGLLELFNKATKFYQNFIKGE